MVDILVSVLFALSALRIRPNLLGFGAELVERYFFARFVVCTLVLAILNGLNYIPLIGYKEGSRDPGNGL